MFEYVECRMCVWEGWADAMECVEVKRTTWGRWLPPSTKCAPESELKLAGVTASAFIY